MPALTAANVRPPATDVGTGRSVVVPSPTRPESFRPQQDAWPAAVRSHECLLPASTCTEAPVATNSTVPGDAAAAAASLLPAGALVDPSTQGADAHPSDPVTLSALAPPPTVPPPAATVKVTGSPTNGRVDACNVVMQTAGSNCTFVPTKAVWLSVAATFVSVARRAQPKKLKELVRPPAPRSTACRGRGVRARPIRPTSVRSPALASARKRPGPAPSDRPTTGGVGLKVAQFKNGASPSSRGTSSCSPASSRRSIS